MRLVKMVKIVILIVAVLYCLALPVYLSQRHLSARIPLLPINDKFNKLNRILKNNHELTNNGMHNLLKKYYRDLVKQKYNGKTEIFEINISSLNANGMTCKIFRSSLRTQNTEDIAVFFNDRMKNTVVVYQINY